MVLELVVVGVLALPVHLVLTLPEDNILHR